MANRPISQNLPADLPTNWTQNQIVAPNGSDVGQSTEYGYNYLNRQINDAQNAVNTINAAFDGLTANNVPTPAFGTCSTAADVAEKTVTVTGGASTFTLYTGVSVRIKFTNANTASNPTLNVNNTGAFPIGRTSLYLVNTDAWEEGEYKDFVYNGAWIMVDGGIIPISRGGTGAKSSAKGLHSLIDGSSAITAANVADTDYIGLDDVSATTGKKMLMSELASYIGSSVLPSGCIIMWSGTTSNIPTGFALCDGNNGTPDLRDRFIIGAGNTYTAGATGGATTHTHTYSGKTDYGTNYPSVYRGTETTANGAHDHTYSGTTSASSSLPPYYALCFIMKL